MRAGAKTSEFWITVFVNLGAMFTALAGIYSGHAAAAMIVASTIMGITTSAYTISRGLAKKEQAK